MKKDIEKYLEWKGTYAKWAANRYRIWLHRFDEIAGKETEMLCLDDIVKFHNFIKDRFKPKTQQYGMTIVKNFIHFLGKQNRCSLDYQLIRITKTNGKPHDAVSQSEYKQVLGTIDPSTFRELQRLVVIRLLWETGVRVSELCDLNISDVNTVGNYADIPTKKTGDMRRIFWGKETNVFLCKYLGVRICLNQQQPLFMGMFCDGSVRTRIHPRCVQRMVLEVARRAGIGHKITPHSFRHGKAHYVLSKGGNVKDVQLILGHRSPVSSFLYLQLNDKENQVRAKRFLRS